MFLSSFSSAPSPLPPSPSVVIHTGISHNFPPSPPFLLPHPVNFSVDSPVLYDMLAHFITV